MELKCDCGSTLSTCKYDIYKKLQQPKLCCETIEDVHSIKKKCIRYLLDRNPNSRLTSLSVKMTSF